MIKIKSKNHSILLEFLNREAAEDFLFLTILSVAGDKALSLEHPSTGENAFGWKSLKTFFL